MMAAGGDDIPPVDSRPNDAPAPAPRTGAIADQMSPEAANDGAAGGAGGARPEEQGGPSGPEPTRFGDWERKGRCIDF